MSTQEYIQRTLATLDDATAKATHADPLISALCEHNHHISKDYCVAALLRIAAIDSDIIYNSPNRMTALNLIRERIEVTGRRILTKYKLEGRIQADEECRKIADIFLDALKDLDSTCELYTAISTLPNFRNRLPRTLNSDHVKVSIIPLLRFGSDPFAALNQCLRAALNYTEADADQAASCHQTVQTLLQDIVASYDSAPSVPERPIVETLRRLSKHLETHFANSPYGKPADLYLSRRPRLYPLHLPQRELSIPIDLRNAGEGVAIDVEVSMEQAIGLTNIGGLIRLPTFKKRSMIIECSATTDPNHDTNQPALCEFRLRWVNTDGTESERRAEITLEAQDPSVDWGKLRRINPYSLEAVTSEGELIGRSQMLDRVVRTLNTPTVGSLYIHGEKRVGKTSLARVSLDVMERDFNMICIFRDIGGINHPVPAQAINNLTESVAAEIANRIPMFSEQVRSLNLDGSLASLNRLMENVARSGARVVVAFDEFDRLPAQLFRRTAEQDAFFTGLRSLSSIPGIGLVLVAGERMKLIINGPGVELNRFAAFPVDYLARSGQWGDFADLVRAPTRHFLEFSEDACERVYTYTAGNPYYTKLICAVVLENAIDRRDSFVDDREIDTAVNVLLTRIDPTSFSHYWEDFLLEEDDRRDEVTLNRRRLLLALGLAVGSDFTAHEASIVAKAAELGLDSTGTRRELDGFLNRKLLTSDDTVVAPRIRLFGRWIVSRGHEQIVLTAVELEAAEAAMAKRDTFRVSLEEADALVGSWSIYRGSTLTGERVLQYLDQFGDVRDQRLVFCLLKKLHFLGDTEERRLLKDAYIQLRNELMARHGQWNRKQILISYGGSIGGSGLAMARSFAITNGFLRTREIRRPSTLKGEVANGVTDIVVVDDFVGTGETMVHQIGRLWEYIPHEQTVHIFILAGMANGVDRVSAAAQEAFGDSRVSVRCLYEMPSDPGPFDSRSGVFASEDDAADARRIAEDFGRRLEKNVPLGFGACCSLITFSRTIPNNALPILWSSSASRDFQFKPLFPCN